MMIRLSSRLYMIISFMEKKRKEIYIYIYIDEKYETLCLYAHTIIITL